ncbi:MAG: hypothetical protein IPL71_03735 [Anaerolineales bacterium]|uniref:hypothetical protein n=1 Tax=Candidatus Villigracilis proximus TaxID=3140683 RepID=UPI0031370D58|nr:hypothetical protein [Anaerolineales bacterium]
MAEHRENIILRCPVCFARENDVVLLREGVMFYCVKCGFEGDEARVRELYADQQKNIAGARGG